MNRRLLLPVVLLAASAFARAPSSAFERFESWAKKGGDESAGVALAKERRAAMADLMRRDPAAALALHRDAQDLPASVAQLLEEPIHGNGEVEVLGFLTRNRTAGVEYRIHLGKRRFAFVPIERGLVTGPAVLDGFVVDGFAVVHATQSHAPGGPQAAGWTTGNKKMLLMRVDFPDAPGAPLSDVAAQSLLDTENAYWKANSFNKLNVNNAVYTTVLRLPRNKADYAASNDDQGLLDDSRNAAHNAGYTGYDFDVVCFSSISAWGWAGLGFVGASGAWLNGYFDPGVIEHETGHNLGFQHANFWQADQDTIIGNGSSQEYGNPFEVMGSGSGHYNAWYKDIATWFGNNEVQIVAGPNDSGSYRVQDLEASVLGGVHAVRVPLSAALDYWVEYRPNSGGGPGLSTGVVVNWGYDTSTQSNLLDMTPWTADATDSALQLGQTFADTSAGIFITPVQANSGTSPASIDVVVNRGLFPSNHAPTVSLNASATSLTTGQQVTLTATATDADNDPLAYWWQLDDGVAYPNAASIITSFPFATEITASVIVSDMKGGFGSAFVVLKVGSPGTYRVSGAVKENGAGVVGVRVYSGSHMTFTDSAGNYTLTGLVGGSTSVQALKPGYTITPSFTNPLTINGNLTNIDFVATRATYTLSGSITSVGQAVSGATVSAGQYTTLSDSTGHYNLNGVPNGAYNLTVSLVGAASFVPQGFANPIVVAGAGQSNLNFVENVFPISGEVTGVAGPHSVTDGTHVVQTANNGGHWLYTLPKVPPGQWNIVATASGQVITPIFTNPVTVSTAALTGKDFTSVAGTGSQVSGHIDEAGSPLLGATVSDGTRVSGTDSNGNYVLVGVPDGMYTLTPAKAGYQFTPPTLSVTVAGADSTGNDFGVFGANAPPTIAIPPHANPSLVKGTTSMLTVLGADPVEGEAALSYTWSLNFGPAPVTFSPNGTNAAKGCTATFTLPGAYIIDLVVTDGGGKTATASITVVVVQNYSTVAIVPGSPMVQVGDTKQFIAQVTDQFGGMVDFGGEAQWSISGGGSISASGKFTATSPGDFVITASVMGVMGTTPVHIVVGPVPHLTMGPTATPNPVTGNSTVLAVVADDDMGEPGLTYHWSAVQPPAAVAFAANDTNAAKNTTATFTALGTYNLQVDVTDMAGLSASGFVTVQVLGGGVATVTIAPSGSTVGVGKTLQFAAQGKDITGATVAPMGCSWSVSGGGAIDTNGLLTANAAGDFNVSVVCNGAMASAPFHVTTNGGSGGGAGGGGGSGGGKGGCGCGETSGASWVFALLLGLLGTTARRKPSPAGREKVAAAKRGRMRVDQRTPRSEPKRRWNLLGLRALRRLTLTRRPQAGATLSRQSGRGIIFALAMTGCTGLEPSSAHYAPTPTKVAHSEAALGEPAAGYPSDQERILHVLVNQARQDGKTPNMNACGDYSAEVPVPKIPLVYDYDANLGARFTSRHLSELGCYQHDNCCVLGDAGAGTIGCIAPGGCTGGTCAKTCDAGTGQNAAERYGLFGFNSLLSEGIGTNVASGYSFWCSLVQSDANRAAMRDDAGTQFGGGYYNAQNQTCTGTYWTVAYGNGQAQVPLIPAGAAIYEPPNPINTANLAFAANYYDPAGAPLRSEVVVNGHCFDIDLSFGAPNNGTYWASFNDPDVLPDGCHPYYFLFTQADGGRVTYPTVGSFQVPLGDQVTCPLAYDPSPQLGADCETGMQQCPQGGMQKCYTADPNTLGKGECRQGYQICRNNFWSACKDMIAPFPESCDGLDNDCNGIVDDNDPGAGEVCQVFGERGICQQGVKHCVSGRLTCVSNQVPQTEVCNGIDDDCDGVIDDGFSIITCGTGACFRVATACDGQNAGVCVPGDPQPETSDLLDNDCDGVVDNGFSCLFPDGGGAGRFTNTPAPNVLWVDGGLYAYTLPCTGGTLRCQADGGWQVLNADVLPSKELCDGVDNDCNGKSDVMDINAIGWDRCGEGACLSFTPICKAGSPFTCAPMMSSAEVCNGVDDNCDGTIDEGCGCRIGDSRVCYTGPSPTRDVGVCKAGERDCQDGGYSKCLKEVVPSQEYCNTLDDDCNGRVDDLCLPDAGGSGGGAGGGGGGANDGGTGGGSGGGTGGGSGGGGDSKKGCGCSSSALSPMILGLLLLARRKKRE